MEDLSDYGENVAYISANICQDKEIFKEMHKAVADEIGGFVMVRSLCAETIIEVAIEESAHVASEGWNWKEQQKNIPA